MFAQGLGFDGTHGRGGSAPLADLLFTLLAGACGVVIVLALLVLMLVLFNLTLANTLRQVHPARRRMNPSLVWFNLIPVLNLAWGIATVLWVSASLRAEFAGRGEHRRGTRYGLVTGLTGLASPLLTGLAYWLASQLHAWPSTLEFIGILFVASVALAGVLFVAYWIRIARYGFGLSEGSPEPPPPQARRVS